MKRNLFTPYLALFFAAILLSFTFLAAYSVISAEDLVRTIRRDRMEASASGVAQSLAGLIVVGNKSFDLLVEVNPEVLQTTLRVQAGKDGILIFVTDRAGKVLLTSNARFVDTGEKLNGDTATAALQRAREDAYFESDLDGILPSTATVRTMAIEERDFQGDRDQVVGIVFIVSMESDPNHLLSGLLRGFLLAGIFVIVVTLLSFFYFHRMLVRPIRLLDDAAGRYAKGDFSVRLPDSGNGNLDALMVAFNEMAEHVDRTEKDRQTFVANISHDLRTPMTTIGGYVQNLLEGTIPPERQEHYLRVILDEIGRLSRLVEVLLETSRMTAGERKYEMRPMDLCELGRVTLLSFEQRLEELNAQVQFEAKPDRITVQADEDAIHRVIYNLIDNAVKFTPHEGEISLRIWVQGEKALFAIRNSGDGIPAEELPNLFDRFYKSDRSRGLDKSGLGLGLFIVKSIINAHGEEIWVTSSEGAWTEFVFSLPLWE